MDLTKIKFKDHKPYCEAGSGDTVWFEADGVDYYVENDGSIAEAAQYIPLNEDQKGELESALGDGGDFANIIAIVQPMRITGGVLSGGCL